MTIDVKNNIIDNINKYIYIQEKKDAISLSLKSDIEEAIELVKKSNNRDKIISMFNTEIKNKIRKLIDGDII